MSEQQVNANSQPAPPEGRPVGGTEYSWCKAVGGGTGITVLALLLSKPPDFSLLQNALRKLQSAHPILRSKLHLINTTSTNNSTNTNTFSYITPPTPHLKIQQFDLSSTADILTKPNANHPSSISPFHLILEHELNHNSWCNHEVNAEIDVFFANVYCLNHNQWALTLRLHTSACDRTTAASLLRELLLGWLMLMGTKEGDRQGVVEREELKSEAEEIISLGIEECIPSGKANKPFWGRGLDLIGYSFNSFRLANLNFIDIDSPRSSQVARLQMNSDDTHRILSGCKSRGIGLCGALAAAGLIAARSSKCLPDDQWEKYAVVTLIDCRGLLDPILSINHLGFYHSAILNTHDIRGGEKLWELAKRTYMAFANAKKKNKHFSDMADINFLMCKAIDNPGLTPSSSLRTSFISVWEDPAIDHTNKMHKEIGLQDYIGCASVHGVGPSIAIFDTIRDGQLDCACVYPSPLHSREQIQELVEDMKRILVDGSSCVESEI